MKCIIYIFSGTGNTRLVADLYKEYLTNYETTVYEIKEPALNVPNPNDYDLIGIGHPVHGFNAPKIMWDFCKKLPQVQNKTTFILTTSGEGLSLNDFATQKIVRNMHRKGYNFVQQRRYVMPYNMIFRHSPEMVKSEWLYAKKLVEKSCAQLMNNETSKVYHYHFASFWIPIVRILWLYAKIQSPFMKVDMNKCIKCQKCVKTCPYGNITFNEQTNTFKFGTKCVLCVGCSFGCPTEAISIGLLNNWRINGDYKIKQTAADESINYPYFTKENLRGIKKIAYLRYFQKLTKFLGL